MAVTLNDAADKTVTTAGTRVQLTTSNINVNSIIIQAKSGNTGKIYVGTSAVSSTRCVAELSAGQSWNFDFTDVQKGILETLNISQIWLDSSVNGEGVHYGYLTKSA